MIDKPAFSLPFSWTWFWSWSLQTRKQTTWKVTFPTLGLSLNGWYRTPCVSYFLAIMHTPMYHILRGSFGVISRATAPTEIPLLNNCWPPDYGCSQRRTESYQVDKLWWINFRKVSYETLAGFTAQIRAIVSYSRPWGASIETRQISLSSLQKETKW